MESISIAGPSSWCVFRTGSRNCPTATSRATLRAAAEWHINTHSSRATVGSRRPRWLTQDPLGVMAHSFFILHRTSDYQFDLKELPGVMSRGESSRLGVQ